MLFVTRVKKMLYKQSVLSLHLRVGEASPRSLMIARGPLLECYFFIVSINGFSKPFL